MIIKFSFTLPIVVILLTFFGASCLNVNSKESEPDQTVAAFLQYLKADKPNEASELLVNSPVYLDSVLEMKLNKLKGNNIKSEKIEEKATNNNNARQVSPAPRNFNNQDLLRIVTESFEKSLPLNKIIGAVKYKDEAKVTASFLREGYADTRYNFLLYKVDGNWKIFKIYLDNGVEFDLYEYWATERNPT